MIWNLIKKKLGLSETFTIKSGAETLLEVRGNGSDFGITSASGDLQIEVTYNNGTGDNTPEYHALVERWNVFLEKVEARFHEVISQAEEPMADLIDSLEYDVVAVINALQGVQHQSAVQLAKKLDDTWDKLQEELEEMDVSYELIDELDEKRERLRALMDDAIERYKTKTLADAARKVEQNVRRHVDENKLHNCTQCGNLLPIDPWSVVAVNLKCTSCSAVNTYEPDGRVKMLEWAVDHLAEEHAIEEKIAGEKEDGSMQDYYRKYYAFLIEKVPSRKEYYEKLLHARLTDPHFD